MSLPARGAWIEIFSYGSKFEMKTYGRSPRGERGLKFRYGTRRDSHHAGRSPRGERGLKCLIPDPVPDDRGVAPREGSVD